MVVDETYSVCLVEAQGEVIGAFQGCVGSGYRADLVQDDGETVAGVGRSVRVLVMRVSGRSGEGEPAPG